jgi:glutamine synthetase
MTDREIKAYYEIRLEQYVKTLEIEMGMLESMVWEGVLPAISKQMALEKKALSAIPDEDMDINAWKGYLGKLASIKTNLISSIDKMENLRNRIQTLELEEQASLLTDEGLELFSAIRGMCDSCERIISQDIWPYPKYRELLSIS